MVTCVVGQCGFVTHITDRVSLEFLLYWDGRVHFHLTGYRVILVNGKNVGGPIVTCEES